MIAKKVHDSASMDHLGRLYLIGYNKQKHAAIAQLVERIHGKDEVSGSNPDRGSIFLPIFTIITRRVQRKNEID